MEFNATFLVSAISFILFVFIMNYIFYSPLEKFMSERDKLVADTLNDAKEKKEQAENLLSDRDTKLQNALLDGKQLIAKEVDHANEKSRISTTKAKNLSVEKIKQGKDDLFEQNKLAKQDLDNKLEDLANAIVEKVIR